MALPAAFNSVADLVLWSGFKQGASSGQNSVLKGTFAFSQFETALTEARNEIYRRTMQTANAEFSEDRLAELLEAEKYLAISRLWINFSGRIQISFPESNLQAVGEVMSGADTPSPTEKGKQYLDFQAARLRRIGLDLIESNTNRWNIQLATYTPTDRFPCLTENAYSIDCCCGTVHCGGCCCV